MKAGLRVALVLAATLLSACATESVFRPQQTPTEAAPVEPAPGAPRQVEPRPAPRPNINLTGYPPAFQEGYTDGCASARSARRRDEARFKSDVQYAQGWRDGNSVCRR